MITSIDLDRLEELAKAATVEPWFTDFDREVCATLDGGGGAVVLIAQTNPLAELSIEAANANAAFIAALNPETALALISLSRGSGVPEGWSEPTEAMVDAGEIVWVKTWSDVAGRRIRRSMLPEIYRAMIAAAPTPSGGGGLADG